MSKETAQPHLLDLKYWIAIVAALLVFTSSAQNTDNNPDSTAIDFNQAIYSNAAAGEFTPSKGFQLVKNKFASLNFSMYAMARYVNQLPGHQTWYDHLGNQRDFKGRQDIYWHRVMLWFTGYIGSPKLTYMATVWTVFTTQQTVVYGNIGYTFNKHARIAIGITPNTCIRSLQGPFPFFTSIERWRKMRFVADLQTAYL
jgi:hypothetical protein